MRSRTRGAAPLGAVVLTIALVTILQSVPASAATFVVTNTGASGAGSLAQAITDANSNAGPDTISFDPSINGSAIDGSSLPTVSTETTIDGNGQGQTVISGAIDVNQPGALTLRDVTLQGSGTLLNVNSGGAGATASATVSNATLSGGGINVNSGFGSATTATFTNITVTNDGVNVNSGFGGSSTTVSFTGLTVTGGDLNANSLDSVTSVSIDGGSIVGSTGVGLNTNDSGTAVTATRLTVSGSADEGIDHDGGSLSLTASTISGSAESGIVSFGGSLSVVNSTISGNGETGIEALAGSTTLDSVTITGNGSSGEVDAGGLVVEAATTVKNSIIAGNTGDECFVSGATLTSAGTNISDDTTCGLTGGGDQQGANPNLGPLANNGGPTLTHLPGPGPAIDTGATSGCPATDQRGVARPQDGNGDGGAVCDIGAVELAAAAPATTTTSTASTTTTTAVGGVALPRTGVGLLAPAMVAGASLLVTGAASMRMSRRSGRRVHPR